MAKTVRFINHVKINLHSSKIDIARSHENCAAAEDAPAAFFEHVALPAPFWHRCARESAALHGVPSPSVLAR